MSFDDHLNEKIDLSPNITGPKWQLAVPVKLCAGRELASDRALLKCDSLSKLPNETFFL